MTGKQNSSSSISVQTCYSGAMPSTSALASSIFFVMLWVDCGPFLVLVMCPFAVAVEGGRCFVFSSLVNPGKDANSSGCFDSALNIAERGNNPRDWWQNFAISLLLFVIRVFTMLFAILLGVGFMGFDWVGGMVVKIGAGDVVAWVGLVAG